MKMKNGKQYNLHFKNRLIQNYYFYLFILIFFYLFKIYKFIPFLEYPTSITLLNGNIFIIHSKGIDIYDSSMNYHVNHCLSFSSTLNEEDSRKTIISRFSERDHGYLISIIKDCLYIFDYNGTFLYQNETKIQNFE